MQHKGDLPGRLIGMLVFLVGVGLLLLVFKAAYGLFAMSPADALALKFTGNAKTDPSAQQIGMSFGWLLIKIAFLFIMSVAASLVSQKGVNMYFSALRGEPVNITARQHTPGTTISPPA